MPIDRATARRRPTDKAMRDAWLAFYITLNERFAVPLKLRIALADAYSRCLKCPAYRHAPAHQPTGRTKRGKGKR